jgi:hypothetical protein
VTLLTLLGILLMLAPVFLLQGSPLMSFCILGGIGVFLIPLPLAIYRYTHG